MRTGRAAEIVQPILASSRLTVTISTAMAHASLTLLGGAENFFGVYSCKTLILEGFVKIFFAHRDESRLLMVSLAALALALAVWQAPAVQAAPKSNISITVDTTADDNTVTFQACSGAGGDCTLRGAISLANSDTSNAYTIIVPAGTYSLTLVGTSENANADGDLDISASVIISGAGAATTIINGNHTVTGERAIHILGSPSVAISGLTVKNGGGGGDGSGIRLDDTATLSLSNCVISDNVNNAGTGLANYGGPVIIDGCTFTRNSTSGNGAGILNNSVMTVSNSSIFSNTSGNGGGIMNGGRLVLRNSTVVSNSSSSNGGGISSSGDMTITDSSILTNTSTSSGGGIANPASGKLFISNSTISGNKTTIGEGGGINHGGIGLTVDQSTISNNQASGSGGAILSTGPMTLTNSTVYSNTGALGGGIYASADGILVNDTFSQNWTPGGDGGGIELISAVMAITNTSIISNTAGSGGGSGINVAGGLATLKNTLVANNPGGNCGGGSVVASSGNNISTDATCTGFVMTSDQTGVTNPGVGPLANNGGPTQTHALLPGSPAIDTGSDVGCPSTDQRGVHRPRGAHCDIGAFEAFATIFLPLIVR